ncbi:hypothetical protein ACM46_11875 [Chryseobacterium angstadtii]|uniref:DUF6850 domain-containing protein n=1 Tax=Chryseobacterium angstadtii TaxID=558151 RepID=A0A0J7L858_9FLAO|nr:hypothetical protein ACM46_11875 [Chryseobacterium angstadtii]
MTKTKAVFCLCCFFTFPSIGAQVQSLDSINIDPVEQQLRLQNPEISFSLPLEFTKTAIYFNTEKLNFKRVQTPGQSTQYGFGAAGVFQLNKNVILSGKLDVNRIDEKDVPYILTDERTTDQNYISNPSYFYAPRKSDWMKQNYHIEGKLAYQPVKNLIVTAGVKGSFLKAYANSDPRPEIGNFEYEAEAKIGYIFKKHGVFVKGSYFNRKKESDIIYNITELNAPSNYDTYIRFNKGYGNYYYNDGYKNTEYAYDGISYGLEYRFISDRSFLTVGYENKYYIDRMFFWNIYQSRDENNVLQYYRDKLKITGLKTDRNIIYINYIGNLGKWKWNSDLIFEDQKDMNYDYQNLYTSYRAYNTEIKFQNYFSTFNAKNELFRIGIKAGFGDQDIRDLSVVMHKKLSYFDYVVNAEKELRIATNQKLGVNVSQSLYLPINKLYDYLPYQSNQTNVFVKNIVEPDNAYDTSTQMRLGMQLKYLLDLKKVRYEIYAGVNQTFFVNNDNQYYKSLLNTKVNRYFNFGINFYY